jgi:hypothetical protein
MRTRGAPRRQAQGPCCCVRSRQSRLPDEEQQRRRCEWLTLEANSRRVSRPHGRRACRSDASRAGSVPSDLPVSSRGRRATATAMWMAGFSTRQPALLVVRNEQLGRLAFISSSFVARVPLAIRGGFASAPGRRGRARWRRAVQSWTARLFVRRSRPMRVGSIDRGGTSVYLPPVRVMSQPLLWRSR